MISVNLSSVLPTHRKRRKREQAVHPRAAPAPCCSVNGQAKPEAGTRVCLSLTDAPRQGSTQCVGNAAMSPRRCFAGSEPSITYTAFLREPGGLANADFVAAAAIHTVTGGSYEHALGLQVLQALGRSLPGLGSHCCRNNNCHAYIQSPSRKRSLALY